MKFFLVFYCIFAYCGLSHGAGATVGGSEVIGKSPSSEQAEGDGLGRTRTKGENDTVDTVIITRPQGDSDHRLDYSYDMLIAALEETKSDYGEYRFEIASVAMIRNRQFSELVKGGMINVAVSTPKKEWNKVLRIPFPIFRGLGSYRIYFVTSKNRNIFQNVNSIDELKAKRTGVEAHWTTTKILKHHGFNLVVGPNYNSLFNMLALGRFNVFPRGLNEIFQEQNTFNSQFPEIEIDQYVAVFTYLPTYFYVSPTVPKLAKRIEEGLLRGWRSGSLKRVFDKHYGESIKKANLAQRKIFFLDNINLEKGMYEHDLQYLLDLPSPSGGGK